MISPTPSLGLACSTPTVIYGSKSPHCEPLGCPDLSGHRFHRSMSRPFFTRERISDFDLFDRHAGM